MRRLSTALADIFGGMTGHTPETDSEDAKALPPGGKAQECYNNLKNTIRALYPEGISERECDEATRNFIGFGKLALEIIRENGLDADDEW